ANEKVAQSLKTPEHIIVELQGDTKTLPLANASLSYDIEKSVQNAYFLGRDKNIKNNILFLLKAVNNSTNLPLEFTINKDELEKNIQVFREVNVLDPVYPTIIKVGNEYVIEKGSQ